MPIEIKELVIKANLTSEEKVQKAISNIRLLIDELRNRELPEGIASLVNEEIETINSISTSTKELKKQIRKSKARIMKIVEKELKLVPRNYYRNMWLALGMAVFGVPMGVAYGAAFDNMGFIGIGIPIGMVIGMAIGASMDKKAEKEGRQLNFDVNQ